MANSDKQVEDEASVDQGLEPMLQAHIGKKLRELYDGMAQDPVPDRFRILLDQLEAGEHSATSDGHSAADAEDASARDPAAKPTQAATSGLPDKLADSV